jgi:hypothetical protein
MGFTYLVCILIVSIIGSKPGAGPHHLIPFLPGFSFLLVRMTQPAYFRGNETAQTAGLVACFLAIIVSYSLAFAVSLNDIRNALPSMEANRAAIPEVVRLYRTYPGAVMGIGGDNTYRLTDTRVVGIFGGAPLEIEMPTVWDFQMAGMFEEPVERLLSDCRTPFWIIPKGEGIFTASNPYWGIQMFSDRFREFFRARYTLIHDDEHYVVWGCDAHRRDQ